MRGNAIQNRSHLDLDIFFGDIRIEHLGAIGLRKYGLAYIFAYLSVVYIEGRNHIDIASSVTTDIIVHQSDAFFFICVFIIFDPLNQGACAVSHARDCQPYLFQPLFPSWVK